MPLMICCENVMNISLLKKKKLTRKQIFSLPIPLCTNVLKRVTLHLVQIWCVNFLQDKKLIQKFNYYVVDLKLTSIIFIVMLICKHFAVKLIANLTRTRTPHLEMVSPLTI